MSLIVAANLVDRIYMCADTRLSRYQEIDGQKNTIVEHDNLQKIIVSKNPQCAIGCVGSPGLASFIIEKIQINFAEVQYANRLKKILSNNQDLLLSWIDEYLTKNCIEYSDARCVLVIGGQNPNCKRLIDGSRIVDLAREYQEAEKERIEKIFEGKELEEFTEKDFHRLFHEKNTMTIKDILFQGMFNKNNRDGKVELNLPGQTLFAIEVRPENWSNDEDIITIKNYKWGETAVYGGGLGKEILVPSFFGQLDLRKGSGKFSEDMVPFASAIKDNFGDTIGGGMTNFILMNGEIMTITQHMRRINPDNMEVEFIYHTEIVDGVLFHYINGKRHKLINFNDQDKVDQTSKFLSMTMD